MDIIRSMMRKLFPSKFSQNTTKELDENQKLINFRNECSLEYYPLSNKYFPKYRNDYLKKNYRTGIINLEKPEFFHYADSFSSKEEGWDHIDLFIEQQFKVNVVMITR